MTARELIVELSKYPLDAEVYVDASCVNDDSFMYIPSSIRAWRDCGGNRSDVNVLYFRNGDSPCLILD